jgi:hypothetical protein
MQTVQDFRSRNEGKSMTSVTSRRPGEGAGAFRLDLTIGRTSYAIQPVSETPRAVARAFRLVKLDGTIYDVASTAYGPVCDCPDYIFRRDGLDPSGCKHIKALVGTGLIEADLTTPASATG